MAGMEEFRDLYKLLGVSRNASRREIQSAYRRLAKRYHPDINPNDPVASERIKEINTAYDILKDPDKKKKYDASYDEWRKTVLADILGETIPFPVNDICLVAGLSLMSEPGSRLKVITIRRSPLDDRETFLKDRQYGVSDRPFKVYRLENQEPPDNLLVCRRVDDWRQLDDRHRKITVLGRDETYEWDHFFNEHSFQLLAKTKGKLPPYFWEVYPPPGVFEYYQAIKILAFRIGNSSIDWEAGWSQLPKKVIWEIADMGYYMAERRGKTRSMTEPVIEISFQDFRSSLEKIKREGRIIDETAYWEKEASREPGRVL